MKKIINLTLALVAGLAIAGCAKEYDDSTLSDKVDALEKKVTELDQKVTALTEQVTGLSATIEQWKTGGFVESVTDIKEGDVVIGYTVKFVGGQTVVLYNGEKGEKGDTGEVGGAGAAGADGKTPEIISYEGDLVWAIDGTPVLVDGKPVSASVVPTFTVNDEGHLIMTLKGVETDLGLVKGADGQDGAGAGDSILKSIEPSADGSELVFTLNGDPEVVYSIPFAKAFKLVIENPEQEVTAGAIVKIPFTIQNGEGAVVDCFAGGNYIAKIDGSDVVVTVPDPLVAGQVLVWAQNDKGLFSMVKLSFITAAELVVVTTEDDYQAIPSAAGDFEIDLTSNVDLDAKVPAEATWVKAVVTKADYKLTLTLEENETGEPREADIEIVRADNDNVVKTIKIVQLASTTPAPAKDILNYSVIGVEGTTYTAWTVTETTSGAEYAGISAGGGSNNSIQINNSSNKTYGFVTTKTAGLVRKVKVTWNTATTATRNLYLYGSNTAFTSTDDLYDLNTNGTFLANIEYSSAENNVKEVEIEGDYAYIGAISAKSAQYIDEIAISWEKDAVATPVTPSYNWDFSSTEWQNEFAEFGAADTDLTGFLINYDGLNLVSIAKSKYSATYFTFGGGVQSTNSRKIDRYVAFDAPSDGYVMVVASNTGDSAAEDRNITLENAGATESKVGGTPASTPTNAVFEVKAGRVVIYPSASLRFYKILFSETDPAAPKELTIKNLYVKTTDAEGIWCKDFTSSSDFRNIAIDDEHIYLTEFNGTKNIWALDLQDPTKYTKLPSSTVESTSSYGIYTACPRVMKNTNNSINGGKDVLLVSNLGGGDDYRVYVYGNGIDNDPSVINLSGTGRLGDTFTTTGTFDKGILFFAKNGGNGVVTFQMNGVATGTRYLVNRLAMTTDAACAYHPFPENFTSGILAKRSETRGMSEVCDATEDQIWNTWDTAFNVTETQLEYAEGRNGYVAGYNFIEFGDKRYVIYGKRQSATEGRVYILEGELSDSWLDIINKAEVKFRRDFTCTSGSGSSHSGLDVTARVIGDELYIAAVYQHVGLGVWKLLYE